MVRLFPSGVMRAHFSWYPSRPSITAGKARARQDISVRGAGSTERGEGGHTAGAARPRSRKRPGCALGSSWQARPLPATAALLVAATGPVACWAPAGKRGRLPLRGKRPRSRNRPGCALGSSGQARPLAATVTLLVAATGPVAAGLQLASEAASRYGGAARSRNRPGCALGSSGQARPLAATVERLVAATGPVASWHPAGKRGRLPLR